MELLRVLNLPLGDWQKGEIQIVTDIDQIRSIEHEMYERCDGIRTSNSCIAGIITEDKYFIFVRDAVIFPSGQRGLYARVIYSNAMRGTPGIALFPMTENGRIILSLVYRHANRQYTLETPGTIGKDGESHEDAISRCIKSDFDLDKIIRIHKLSDHFVSERGLLTAQVPFYAVIITAPRSSSDLTIHGHLSLTKSELKDALRAGIFMHEGRPYAVHDGYMVFGLQMSEILGLI